MARTVRRVAQKEPPRWLRVSAAAGIRGSLASSSGEFVVRELIVLVGAPLPDIPGHVKESVAVGGNCPTGAVPEYRSALVLIVGNVPCHTLACFGAPYRRPTRTGHRTATSSGRFPFVFGGESFARPLGVGVRVVPRHVDHRMVHAILNGTLGLPGDANTPGTRATNR